MNTVEILIRFVQNFITVLMMYKYCELNVSQKTGSTREVHKVIILTVLVEEKIYKDN